MTNRCKVHKYRRYSKNSKFRTDIFYCVNCPSYKLINMIIGSHTLCWKCGREMTMTEKTLQLKPTCDLHKIKDEKVQDIVNRMMEKL